MVILGAIAWLRTGDATRAKPLAAADGQVVAVIDGDTIGVMLDGKETRVRLYGIDAPEKSQPHGMDAKAALSGMIFGKVVRIEDHGQDRYGRKIGRIHCQDRDINLELVRDGWAWWYVDYAKRDSELSSAEAEAREARRGLWADPDQIPPWEWRAERVNERRSKQ